MLILVNFTALVISDEVAEMAWTSHTYFFSALDSFISEGKIGKIALLMYVHELIHATFQIRLLQQKLGFSLAVL